MLNYKYYTVLIARRVLSRSTHCSHVPFQGIHCLLSSPPLFSSGRRRRSQSGVVRTPHERSSIERTISARAATRPGARSQLADRHEFSRTYILCTVLYIHSFDAAVHSNIRWVYFIFSCSLYTGRNARARISTCIKYCMYSVCIRSSF